MNVATKETIKFFATRFKYFGTDGVDANAAGHINGITFYIAIECTVGG